MASTSTGVGKLSKSAMERVLSGRIEKRDSKPTGHAQLTLGRIATAGKRLAGRVLSYMPYGASAASGKGYMLVNGRIVC